MFFKQRANPDASLSYFLGCGSKGKAIAVDVVAGDETWFVEETKRAGVTVTHVIDTHLHADHYSGGRRLAEQLGAQYCLYENAPVQFPFYKLQDNETIEVGNVVAQVLHTPGHTLDSVCLLVTDNRRAEEPWFLITGDTLFVGTIGRPDLAGHEQEMAAMLFDSLQRKILNLPDAIEIFPGHQAGSVCGVGLSGKPSSTLGFEKRFNPGLKLKDKFAFVQYLTANIPPRPADMDRIVAANTSGLPVDDSTAQHTG